MGSHDLAALAELAEWLREERWWEGEAVKAERLCQAAWKRQPQLKLPPN